MKFEWDDNKAIANFKKHGVEFEFAKQLFDNPSIVIEDTRFPYDEERFIIIGFIGFDAYVVIYTYIDDHTIRLISARKTTNYERKRYLD